MAGVIAPTPPNPSLAARAREFLGAQITDQTLRWRLWAPVAFGGGCAVYFALKTEPPAWPLIAGALLAAGLWFGARRMALARVWTLLNHLHGEARQVAFTRGLEVAAQLVSGQVFTAARQGNGLQLLTNGRVDALVFLAG